MTRVIDDQKGPRRQPNMRPYHPPRLLVYGDVRELTLGGNGPSPEATGSGYRRTKP
jgi:hypothetical protein